MSNCTECERLRAELERERMRLAACGVVALSDTPESAANARAMHDDYKSASCDDVARRVDECMRLRADLAAKQARIDALMLEYCPEEMTQEQLEEWGKHQRAALGDQPADDAASK